jgi:DNA repair protein RadC
MTPAPTDLALIDAFEKIRAYLLEQDPSLAGDALARPADPSPWSRLSGPEYQETLLSVLLGMDRRTAAGRRALRTHLQTLRARADKDDSWQVSDGDRRSERRELFRPDRHERWLRDNEAAVIRALNGLAPESDGGPPPLIAAISRSPTLRDVASQLRKQTRLLGGLRAYEFLSQIGYSIVIPDPARQRLFHRLGWLQKATPPGTFAQDFFELCDRLVHLTTEPHAVVNAAAGLFAGSRDARVAAAQSPAVCTPRPRCGQCVLNGQCAYYRYRGEPQPSTSRPIKRMAFAEQPRTRFESLGPANLSEVELLALIMRTGSQGKSALDLAREILERFGSLEALAQAGLGELCKIKGVGRAKAIEIKAALELGRRILGGPVAIGEAIRRSADIFAVYRPLLAHEQQENFYLVILNARNRVQSHFLISRGSLTGSQVHPREVMKVAIREAAASIIFVHNHPSGEPEPSADDREITDQLTRAAQLFGIRVLDHVIIGRDNYFSFADHNLLESGG